MTGSPTCTSPPCSRTTRPAPAGRSSSSAPTCPSSPTRRPITCSSATSSNGALDPTFGLPATPALVDYLKAAAKLDDADPPPKLGFFFKHLDSADPTIAADAFFEFARAADGDILKAAKSIDPARVRKLIADAEHAARAARRVRVPARHLGRTGRCRVPRADARREPPLRTRRDRLRRLARGSTSCSPRRTGWAFAAHVLADAKRPYSVRLSAIGTVRFLQSTPRRGVQGRGAEVLRRAPAARRPRRPGDRGPPPLGLLGPDGRRARPVRQADARRADRPPRDRPLRPLLPPATRRSAFVAAVRATDPKLVKSVEEMLELYKPK